MAIPFSASAAMVIVFNPVAGRRRASLLWRVLDVLVANGVRLDLAETLWPGHAEALAREAVSKGETLVVAAGGDGTIAEVANGLMGSPARLGVIPLGTANVLAHELALPFAPRAVAAALAFGRTRLLWPGLAQGEVLRSAPRPDAGSPDGISSRPYSGASLRNARGEAWIAAEDSGSWMMTADCGSPMMASRAGQPTQGFDGGPRSRGEDDAPWMSGADGDGRAARSGPGSASGDSTLASGQADPARLIATAAGDAPRGCGPGSRLFVQMLGVGFDAQVVHNLPGGLKRMFGKGAYVLQTLNTLLRYDYPAIQLRIDGRETSAASVIISKGVLYGGTYRLAPDARPAEPGFSVVLFDHGGPAAALLYGMALPMNLLQGGRGVRHIRAERIDVIGNRRMPVQTDGDPAGFAPLSVTAAPAPIQVVSG